MPDTDDSNNSEKLLKREMRLLSSFNDFYRRVLRKVNSAGRAPEQFVQRTEKVDSGRYSVVVTVLPAGVEITYSSDISDTGGDYACINQSVFFKGLDTGENRSVHDAYSVSLEDGAMGNATPINVDQVAARLLRNYAEILFGQCKLRSDRKGISVLPVQVVGGVPGVGRRLNIANIGDFKSAGGDDYDADVIDNRVLSVLEQHSDDILRFEHDGLYILGRDMLIGCGDSSLLECILCQGAGEGNDAGLKSAYDAAKGWMSLYEHDDAIIRLVENVFPASGRVFVNPVSAGIVGQLFEFYVFSPKKDTQAVFEDKWLSLDADGLKIRFLGDVADAELKELMPAYAKKDNEIKETRRRLEGIKRGFC